MASVRITSMQPKKLSVPMPELHEVQIRCPYCGASSWTLIDDTAEQQHYIEDCQVCCRPVIFVTHCHPGETPLVEVRREDDG